VLAASGGAAPSSTGAATGGVAVDGACVTAAPAGSDAVAIDTPQRIERNGRSARPDGMARGL
jgi:hypothetical protein